MPVIFRSNQNIAVAAVTGFLDAAQGEVLVSEVRKRVPQGGKLIIDGTALGGMTPEGLTHLVTIQEWSSNPERRRLRLSGFAPALWQVIVKHNREILFEDTEALPEALDSLGVEATASLMGSFGSLSDLDSAATTPGIQSRNRTPAAPPAPPPPSPASPSPPPPPLDPLASAAATATPKPLTRPAPPPPLLAAARPAPAPPPAPPGYPPPAPVGGSKALFFLAIAAAALLLVAVAAGGAWYVFGDRPPVVSVPSGRAVAEEDGKEVDEVTVEVRRGKLEEDSWRGLPPGLFFEAASEGESNNSYLLRGKAENGARTATVQLVAVDAKGRHSPAVPFTVEVREKPLSWQLATLLSLHLQANNPAAGESKFVTGAAVQPEAAGLPSGLRVELAPGTTHDWQLAGTPRQAGRFTVVFKAATSGGQPEEKSCTLQVAEEVPPPVVSTSVVSAPPRASTPAPPAPASSQPAASPTPTPAAAPATAQARAPGGGPGASPVATAGGMREFLLKRIEKLPSRYSDEERENLREAVDELKQSRLAARVIFENTGQTDVSNEQAAKLKAALADPEVEALLKDANCQVAIVGYASKRGSLAANVRISKKRARNVNELFENYASRSADLCGDYGPTDIVDQNSEEANRVVEIYVGVMDLAADQRAKAASFRNTFNRLHGLR